MMMTVQTIHGVLEFQQGSSRRLIMGSDSEKHSANDNREGRKNLRDSGINRKAQRRRLLDAGLLTRFTQSKWAALWFNPASAVDGRKFVFPPPPTGCPPPQLEKMTAKKP